jgi:hypothetical protein
METRVPETIHEIVDHQGVEHHLFVTPERVDFYTGGQHVGFFIRESFGIFGQSPEGAVGHFATKKLLEALGRIVVTTGIWGTEEEEDV